MNTNNPSEPPDPSKPTKRKRLTQACDTCRKKKVKCDGNRPSCSNCIRLKVPCTYLPSLKKRGPRQGQNDKVETTFNKAPDYLRSVASTENVAFASPSQMSGSIQPVGLRPVARANTMSSFMGEQKLRIGSISL
ncbi:hypothetical protein K7432_014259 [Basidiobolus ranarum]|uniref:Zn(2)-C6 fungal-type domain-containing protein n=1 Tax=Basidiobolus ranarum TaxID=34480 RepID=A0ABR2VQM1_9FUNG